MTVRPRSVPAASALARLPPGWATWVDCFEAPLSRSDATALDIHRAVMSRGPRWFEAAMGLRDRVARFVGIRPVMDAEARATMGAPAVAVGDRIGIFTVRAVSPDELVMGDDDVHLDYRLSVLRFEENGPRAAVAMALRTHNLLGRLYMLPVGPIHRLLVRRMLERAVADGAI